jgi:hypothetical protein
MDRSRNASASASRRTNLERLLTHARAGQRIDPTEWADAARVPDGGVPNLRVAADVLKLRRKGHTFTTEYVGRSRRAIYTLIPDVDGGPAQPAPPTAPHSLPQAQGTLFSVAAPFWDRDR